MKEQMNRQYYDSLFVEIARDVVESQSVTHMMIQEKYDVGFNRADRIMIQLERAGIISAYENHRREILLRDLPSLEARLQELGLMKSPMVDYNEDSPTVS